MANPACSFLRRARPAFDEQCGGELMRWLVPYINICHISRPKTLFRHHQPIQREFGVYSYGVSLNLSALSLFVITVPLFPHYPSFSVLSLPSSVAPALPPRPYQT